MNKNKIKEIFEKIGFEAGLTQKGELIGKRIKSSLKSDKTKNVPKASFVFGGKKMDNYGLNFAFRTNLKAQRESTKEIKVMAKEKYGVDLAGSGAEVSLRYVILKMAGEINRLKDGKE